MCVRRTRKRRAAAVVEFAVVSPVLILTTLVDRWRTLPVLCSFCGHAIEADTIGEGEFDAWCPKCKTVFRVPILRIPGWIAGVICLLLVKLQSGL